MLTGETGQDGVWEIQGSQENGWRTGLERQGETWEGETWEARDIVAGSMIWASDLILLEGRRLPINPIEVYGMSTSMRSSKPPTE